VSVATYDSIGSVKDTVELILAGEFKIQDAKSYEFTRSVFSQPGAFALEFGWGDTVGDLLSRFPKGTPYQLRIAGVPLMTGKIDAIGAKSGTGGGSVSVRGRGNIKPLFKDTFLAEKAFSEATYYQLTRKMMEEAGIGDLTLQADNTANRKAVTGHKVVETAPPPPPSDEVEIEQTTTSGQRKVVYNKIKSTLGERRYDFLQTHYKKAGLFLWEAGDGNLVLSRPNGDQKAGYSITRGRGQTRNEVNVEDATFDDDTTERYAKYVVYGRSGGGRKGRVKCRGEWVDPEMSGLGMSETKVMHVQDIKSDKEAELEARREGALQIRSGWRLEYVLAGHLMPSLFDRGAWAIWAPDTVCQVVDQELKIEGLYYVSDVTFSRNDQGTRTKVKLMRRDGLIFGADQ